jgi:hypothetical protein
MKTKPKHRLRMKTKPKHRLTKTQVDKLTPAQKLKLNAAYGKETVSAEMILSCTECGTEFDPLWGHDATSCQLAKNYSRVGHCSNCAGRRSQDMCTCSCVTCCPEEDVGSKTLPGSWRAVHDASVAAQQGPVAPPQVAQGPGTPQGFRERSILERLGDLGETPFFEFLAASFKREHGATGELTHGLERLSDVELTTLSKAIQSVKETWEMEACRKLRRQIDEARSLEKLSEEAFRNRQDETTLKFVEGLELRNVELEESLLFLTLKVLKAQKKKEELPVVKPPPIPWTIYRSEIEMQERVRITAALKAYARSPERPAESSAEAFVRAANMVERNLFK